MNPDWSLIKSSPPIASLLARAAIDCQGFTVNMSPVTRRSQTVQLRWRLLCGDHLWRCRLGSHHEDNVKPLIDHWWLTATGCQWSIYLTIAQAHSYQPAKGFHHWPIDQSTLEDQPASQPTMQPTVGDQQTLFQYAEMLQKHESWR